MRIRFWGTRGSIPVPLTAEAVATKLARAAEHLAAGTAPADLPFHLRATYGGNTACVEVLDTGGERLLLDAGTGLRELGRGLETAPPATYHVLLSHTHWDHIMGLPFFPPTYQRGSRIIFYGCHPQLEGRIAAQFEPAHFPVRFDKLAAEMNFVRLKPGVPAAIAGTTVTAFAQRHPGASYGYRIEHSGKAAVYSTDSEHKTGDARTQDFVAFCADADLLIYDAMYPFLEATTDKAGWGHSSNVTGIELAKRAGVKRLFLFHHDPGLDDEDLDRRLEESVRYAGHYRPEQPLDVSMAYDGLEVAV